MALRVVLATDPVPQPGQLRAGPKPIQVILQPNNLDAWLRHREAHKSQTPDDWS